MIDPANPLRPRLAPSLVRHALLLLPLLLAACASGEAPTPTDEEAQAMLRLVRRSGELVALIEEERGLAERAEGIPLTPDDRARVLSLWATMIDHDLAFRSFTDRFLSNWSDAKGEGKERALVVGLAAHAAKLRAAATLLSFTLDHDALRLTLNEASDDFGVAANHLDRIAIETSTPQAQLMLEIGLTSLDRRFENLRAQKNADDFLELHDDVIAEAEAAQALLNRYGSTIARETIWIVANNQLQLLIDPLAEEIALWLGNTRSRSGGDSLISRAQLDALVPRLRPGDLFLERRNFYLSNLGLPGFWPHAELYIGTPEDWATQLDTDAAVQEVFPDGLADALRRQYPGAWAAFAAPAADGDPHRVLEAISEGVVFSSLWEAAGADYLGVLRPRRTPLERARALQRAFSHVGKPYDFDFDFLTQSELVCSELVWRAYQAPSAEGRSLTFRLSSVVGRTTLPPNDMIAQWDATADDADAQLEFVAFLDGLVGEGRAVERDAAALRASWRRPKWELYLE